MQNKQLGKRCSALLFCTCFVMVALCSVIYIAVMADHECSGDNCHICACICTAKNQFNKLTEKIGSAETAGLLVCAVTTVFVCYGFCLTSETLIKLKIRLNN